MNIENIKKMSDQDISNLKELLDQEVTDRLNEKKAKYLDRFKELFDDAKRDGIVLGICTSTNACEAHAYHNLYVSEWKW